MVRRARWLVTCDARAIRAGGIVLHTQCSTTYETDAVGMDAGFCIKALKEALAKFGTPEIFKHGDAQPDQGSQFTSADFTAILLDAKVKISMDGRGRWIERLWRALKYECIYLNAFETGSETRNGIGAWITYYNEKRPHSSHGLMTPAEAYEPHRTNLKIAA